MKIQVASDLHLDLLESRFPGYRVLQPGAADVLVLAGDIHRHTAALSAFRDWDIPIIYVHGNHEAYHACYDDTVQALRTASAGTKLRYLECDEYVHHGVRFLGCCLWTDYCVYPDNRRAAMAHAEASLYDHRLIRAASGGMFSAHDAERIHQQSRAWLQQKLDQPFSGATVVVTHHAPHPNSIHPRFAGNALNPAFVSDLTALMGKADLWIHGHVHDSFDYRIGATRVVANPRGYALNRRGADSPAQLEWENPLFDPALIIELA